MRTTKLPKREMEICQRLRGARVEILKMTQEACAGELGIDRSTLKNYEVGASPVKYELALKFCHQFIVSEEWLATGTFGAMKAEAERQGGYDRTLDSIFIRQSMDLITEPICRQISPGTRFSEAYDDYLAERYAQAARVFYYAPRILFDATDPPTRQMHIIMAYAERWLKMVEHAATRAGKNTAEMQSRFIRTWLAAGGDVFKQFAGARAAQEMV